MKNIGLIVAIIAICIGVFNAIETQTSKTNLVYINSSKLLDQYQGMIDARKEFKVKTDKWNAEIDTMYSSLKKQITDYERESKNYSKPEALKKKEELQRKSKMIEDHQSALNAKAKEEDDLMTQRVVDEVNTFINSYCEGKKYSMVLGVTQSGNIVYADDKLDVTDEVIVAINRNYRGEK